MNSSYNKSISILKLVIIIIIIYLTVFSNEKIDFKSNTKEFINLYENIRDKKVFLSNKMIQDKLKILFNNYKYLLKDGDDKWINDTKVFIALMSPLLRFQGIINKEENINNVNIALKINLEELNNWSKKRVKKFIGYCTYDKKLKVEDNLYLLLKSYLLREMLLEGDIKSAELELNGLKKQFGNKQIFLIEYFNKELQFYKNNYKSNNMSTTTTLNLMQ